MESKRLDLLNSHFEPQNTSFQAEVGPKHDDDVVIVSMARTALTKFRRGA